MLCRLTVIFFFAITERSGGADTGRPRGTNQATSRQATTAELRAFLGSVEYRENLREQEPER